MKLSEFLTECYCNNCDNLRELLKTSIENFEQIHKKG